eukprot:GGOE01000733.1.p2 GENE.GGOE01000733.1~~GGOE01000733.1.p2  ORF type:complete len:135 (+),score=20.89 GGOE01000733.1:545-949(+)
MGPRKGLSVVVGGAHFAEAVGPGSPSASTNGFRALFGSTGSFHEGRLLAGDALGASTGWAGSDLTAKGFDSWGLHVVEKGQIALVVPPKGELNGLELVGADENGDAELAAGWGCPRLDCDVPLANGDNVDLCPQ